MDEKESKKLDKDINRRIEDTGSTIDLMGKQILGYGNVLNEIINPNVTNIEFNKFTINKVKSVQDNLFNLKGKDKSSDYQINERLYSIFGKPYVNPEELSSLLNGRNALNIELNYIVNEMPELYKALDQLGDDIVSPNVTTSSGIKLEFIGNNSDYDIEKEDHLIKYFKPLDNPLNTLHNRKVFNYNIDDDVKKIIKYFGIYGHMMVASIPYKKIVQDLLYEYRDVDTDDIASAKKESFVAVGEALNIMEETNEMLQSGRRTAYAEALGIDNFPEFISKEQNDAIRNLVSFTPYSESDVEYVTHLLEKGELMTQYKTIDPTIQKVAKQALGEEIDIFNYLTKNKKKSSAENNNFSRITDLTKEVKEKQQKKFNIDRIIGCTHDVLDPSKTVPVYIKDELIGVYVVEHSVHNNSIRLGDHLSNLIDSSNIHDNLNPTTSSSYIQKFRDIIYNDIRKVLMANLDKKLLRNNPNLIEDIQYIMDNNMDENNGLNRIKFIPAEFLTLHKTGSGPLGTPLLLPAKTYALMHIMLLKSDMIAKMFLEKPRLNVSIPFEGDMSNTARMAQSIDSIRGSLPRINDISIPDVMTNSMASFHTVITPLNNDGQPLFQISPIDGMPAVDNTEYLRYLRNQATMVVGYPADLFDPSAQIDFAKKIANINMNLLLKIVSMQNSLSLSLSDFCTKRIKFMTGNDKLEVKVTFEPPSELINQIDEMIINQKNQIIELYKGFLENDTRVPEEHMTQVMQYITKKLLDGIIDDELITEAIEKVTTFKFGSRDLT